MSALDKYLHPCGVVAVARPRLENPAYDIS